MKKRCLSFATAFALCLGLLPAPAFGAGSGAVPINGTTFPDPAFRQVVETLPGAKDGKFTPAELEKITELQCGNRDIASLEGVRYFTELEILNCSDNRLEELNLAGLTDLTQLYCDGNELIDLDVSETPALTHLDCSFNYVRELDVSRNLRLEELNTDIFSHEMTLWVPAQGMLLGRVLGLQEKPEINGGHLDKNGVFSFDQGADTATFLNMRNAVTLRKPAEPVTRTIHSPEGVTLTVTTDHRGRVSADVKCAALFREGMVTVPMTGKVTPGTTAVRVGEDGSETVIRASYPLDGGVRFHVTGDMKVKLEDRTRRFYDVANYEWYRPYVDFVSARRLFAGVAHGEFGPDVPMTRAMLVVVLRSLEEGTHECPESHFSDVAPDAWYADAVGWAAEKGVVSGYPDGRFGPDDPITREQLALMLYNALGAPAIRKDLLTFRDSAAVSSYALTAVRWAVQNGVLSGVGENLLNPGGNASRAEGAAMLMRCVGLMR